MRLRTTPLSEAPLKFPHAVAHCVETADAYQPAPEQFEALLLRLQAPKNQGMTHEELEPLLLIERRARAGARSNPSSALSVSLAPAVLAMLPRKSGA
jgi:hypothetical protein